MIASAILAATIAFPAANQKLPNVERTYMIGAVERGTTNIVVQGRSVDVFRTGAWATMVDVVEGTNTIEICANGITTNRMFVVGAKARVAPQPKPADGASAPSQAAAQEKVWKKLEYASDTAKEHPRGKLPCEITIVLDPGHGGSDTGAISPHGLYEKNANLLAAKAVRTELTNRGYKVLMTREDDRTLVLTERPRLAHESDADLFVSIHHNAPATNQDASKARYTAVYSWNEIGEEVAEAIARRMELALEGEVASKGSLHANFAVTRNPEIPSCLVEIDFITSPEGEEAIFSHARQSYLAGAIADGIEDWIAGE